MTTGKVKSLAFSEGTTVTSATTLTIDTAKLAQYASDAAFVAAKGLAAAAGDVYFNTVDSAAKEYTGAAWRHIVTRDGTETLTAKTLTSPVINTGSLSTPTVTDKALLTETTSPATPSAGFLSMFAKADHKVYLKDSTGVEAPVGGGLSPTYKAANFTASAANNYLCNTTAGAFTATLPAGSTGSTVRFTDDKGTWAGTSTRLTITPNGSETIQGLAAGESLVCDVAGAWVELNWDPTNSVWVPSAPGYTTSVGTTSVVVPGTSAGLVAAAGLPGYTGGSAIAAGYVGETQVSYTGPASLPGANTWGNVTSVTLTAGVWMLFGELLNTRVSGQAQMAVAVSAFSGNTATDHLGGKNYANLSNSTLNDMTLSTGPWIVNISAGATYYLKFKYDAGTTAIGNWVGTLTAVRIA